MATSSPNRILGHLRRVLRGQGSGLSDAQLLGEFVATSDDSAFAALVRRHGPMVLAVCRRILRQHHDAEDAFQATFVVLARKAATLGRRDGLANWLYGVAYRVALEARSLIAQRRMHEQQVESMPEAPVADLDYRADLLALLDREVQRLPEKYRVPVILCELQGLTRRETARRLNLPEGTLSSRLAAARRLLASRLSRHGTHVSLAGITILFATTSTSALGPALVSATVRAAAGTVSAGSAILVQGVLRAMFLTKLRIGLASVLMLASMTAVTFTYRTEAADSARVSPARDDIEALRLEIEALRRSLNATRERVRELEERVAVKTGSSSNASNKPTPETPKKVDPALNAIDPNELEYIIRYYQKANLNNTANAIQDFRAKQLDAREKEVVLASDLALKVQRDAEQHARAMKLADDVIQRLKASQEHRAMSERDLREWVEQKQMALESELTARVQEALVRAKEKPQDPEAMKHLKEHLDRFHSNIKQLFDQLKGLESAKPATEAKPKDQPKPSSSGPKE